MSGQKSKGLINVIEITSDSILVSGRMIFAGRHPASEILLFFGDLVIATLKPDRFEFDQEYAFDFHAPIPIGADSIASITVSDNRRRHRLTPDTNTRIIGALPDFITIDQLNASRQGGGFPTNKQALLFHAEMDGDVIAGIAIDLHKPDHPVALDLMAGPNKISEIIASGPTAIDIGSSIRQSGHGFSVKVPRRDDKRRATDIWFAIGRSSVALSKPLQRIRRPEESLALRVQELNAFDRLERQTAHSGASTSIVIVDLGQSDELEKLLDCLRGVASEIIVVSPLPVRGTQLQSAHGLSLSFLSCNGHTSAARAWNVGAQAARGELLIFIDSSVRLDPGALTNLVTEFSDAEIEIADLSVTVANETWTARVDGMRVAPTTTGAFAIEAGSTMLVAAEAPGCALRVPIVNEWIFGCRASTIRALNGFKEIPIARAAISDFCIRARTRSLSDPVTFGDIGSARLEQSEDVPAARGARFHDPNLPRRVRRDAFDRPGFWLRRPTRIVVVVRRQQGMAQAWARAFASALERVALAEVNLVESASLRNLEGVDLLLTLDPNFRFDHIKGIGCCFTAVACVSDLAHPLANFELAHLIWLIGDDLEAARRAFPGRQIGALPGGPYSDLNAEANQASDLVVEAFEDNVRAAIALFRRHTVDALRFSIKIDTTGSATGVRALASNLVSALHDLGCTARIDDKLEWDRSISAADDCSVVLRTRATHAFGSEAPHLVWLVDQLETITAEELTKYAHIFVPSERCRERLSGIAGAPISTLPFPELMPDKGIQETGASESETLLVLGDASDDEYGVIDHAFDAGFKVTVCGRNWNGLLASAIKVRAPGSEAEMATLFGSSSIVVVLQSKYLKQFGYVSLIAFLAAASRTQVIAARSEALDASITSAIETFDSIREFASLLERLRNEKAQIAPRAAAGVSSAGGSMLDHARSIVEIARQIGLARL